MNVLGLLGWSGARREKGIVCGVIADWSYPGCKLTVEVLQGLVDQGKGLVPVAGAGNRFCHNKEAILFCTYHTLDGTGAPPLGLAQGALGSVELLDSWACNPIILWACWSAKWARSFGRHDWIGFEDLFGYDFSRRTERRWWWMRLSRMLRTILRASRGKENWEAIEEECRETAVSARDRFLKGKGSWTSVLLARGFRHVVSGGEFGK